MTSLYKQLEDYEPTFFDWRTSIFRFACCDCGLVHDFVFKPNGTKSYVKFRRNNRSTGQIRRYKFSGAKWYAILELVNHLMEGE